MRSPFAQTVLKSESLSARIGAAGFVFFLLKGMLWLLAPALFAFLR